jgi:predicted  nucleic acid-binding Zn-ribbon protein
MLVVLKELLEVQEMDMQMLRLIRLKRERMKELKSLATIRNDLLAQCKNKNDEVMEIRSTIRLREIEIQEIQDKIKSAEKKQDSVKKVEEFNALAQEIATAEREKNQLQHRIADEEERLTSDEEVLEKLKQSLETAEKNLKQVTDEVQGALKAINEEGRKIKVERDEMAKSIPNDVMSIYLRLLNNKHDRVVVPIENRTCSGCHIMVTAQHENMVRRAEKMMFCEHCSRIHYLQEAAVAEEESESKPRRRRKSAALV